MGQIGEKVGIRAEFGTATNDRNGCDHPGPEIWLRHKHCPDRSSAAQYVRQVDCQEVWPNTKLLAWCLEKLNHQLVLLASGHITERCWG